MSKDNILFVFEGPKGENQIATNLVKVFADQGLQVIKCAYGGDIYQLYQSLNDEENEFVDLLGLIKERSKSNSKLQKFNHEILNCDTKSISQIYIFFDYDGHDKGANAKHITGDDKIIEMLDYFDNETENGKLFISYPMVEALKDICDYESFKDHVVKCKKKNCVYLTDCDECKSCIQDFDENHYKKQVSNRCLPILKDFTCYNLDTWKDLLYAHLCKMNHIVNDVYEYPLKMESQQSVFVNQKKKYIDKRCPEVAVLSAFPLFVLDFYGLKRIKDVIGC